MTSDGDRRKELLARIKSKRARISAFVRDLEPRNARLTNTSLVCSAVAALLTAGPALSGTTFTSGVQHLLAASDDSFVWRFLCFGALVVSTTAAIATNLSKSSDAAGRLTKAEAANAGLEGLEALVEFGQIHVDEAVKLYQQYVAGIPFIQDPA